MQCSVPDLPPSLQQHTLRKDFPGRTTCGRPVGSLHSRQLQRRSSSGPFGPLLRLCYRRDRLRSDLWDEDGDLDELDSKAWREPGAASWRAESIEGS